MNAHTFRPAAADALRKLAESLLLKATLEETNRRECNSRRLGRQAVVHIAYGRAFTEAADEAISMAERIEAGEVMA